MRVCTVFIFVHTTERWSEHSNDNTPGEAMELVASLQAAGYTAEWVGW